MAASHEEAVTSVVVPLTGLGMASRLLRAALGEAQARASELIILDFENAYDDEGLRSLMAGSHVSVVPVDAGSSSLEHVVRYCESTGAGVLVIDAESIPDIDPKLARRVFRGTFDVLVVADEA